MSNWRPQYIPEYLYFITTSTYRHKPILNNHVTKQIILDQFDFLRRRKMVKLFSFVIMPTHIHFISQFPRNTTYSDFMRNLKSISANRINRYLLCVDPNHHKKHSENRDMKVWEEGYLAKEVFSLPFLDQKFKYIHQNPCRSPWKIVENPEDYPWSSARFYLTSEPCIIPIDDLRDYLV